MILPLIKRGIGGVYAIRNCCDNKIYIGSSVNIRQRLISHTNDLKNKKHANCYLQRAYNKDYQENFELIILEIVNDVDQLTTREQYYINFYNSANREFGYNLIVDAARKTHSLESRQKMSESAKGRIISEETRKKASASLKGRKWSDEERENNKNFWTEERRNKVSEQLKERGSPSEETRKKISESNTGKIRTPEMIEKMSRARLGWKPSAEAIKKSADSKRGKKISEECRRKISDSLKGKPKKYQPIVKISLDNIILERYESIREASRLNDYSRFEIGKACKKSELAYGFKWAYACSDWSNPTSTVLSQRIGLMGFSRPVLKLSLNDKILERYESLTEACKFNNCSMAAMGRACKGNKVTGGFKWSYASTPLNIHESPI